MTRPVVAADGTVTFALWALAVAATVAGVLWGGTAIATLAVAGQLPAGGGLGSVFGMVLHPGNPARVWPEDSGVPGPVPVWAGVSLVAAVVAGAAVVVWRTIRRVNASPAARRRKIHSTAGLANASDVRRHAGPKALAGRAGSIRPQIDAPELRDVGYQLGRSRGVEVWAAAEDSLLVLGPPRSGKGLHLVVAAILDAPGAVVTTSTRADNLAVTLRARERIGPVAVFDPQELAGLDTALRWSPVRGCDSPQTAMIRARALAASTGMDGGGVTSGDFWQGRSAEAIQCILHAAALSGARVDRLYRWSLDPASCRSAVDILRRSPVAAPGWAEALEAVINGDERTRDSVWLGVRQAFAALADPRVRRALDPAPGEEFDPTDLINQRGTLYLLGTAAGAGAAAGFIAALIEDVTETARAIANRAPGARLDPPLALVLDEIANLSPLPSLPRLVADGGGTGITTWVVLQSLAKARAAWGDDDAQAIWDSAIVKVILGGGSAARDLDDLSKLVGERDETTISIGHGADGHRSTNASIRRVPVLPPELVRGLPFGVGVVLLRSAPVMTVDLQRWPDRPDGRQLVDDRDQVETEMTHPEASDAPAR